VPLTIDPGWDPKEKKAIRISDLFFVRANPR